jgi:SAM-dependent methyltransferase
MTPTTARDARALHAYEEMAPIYDAFTAAHRHDVWTEMLVALLRPHGLPERGSLLDVGCGTGKSFLPWEARGWDVVACDASPAMLRIAAAKAGPATETLVADARDLGVLGSFDLVVLTDDVLNYLDPDEVDDALAGVARNLAPGGLLAFDVNTLGTYRTAFAQTHVSESEGCFAVWRGGASADFLPGETAEAVVDGFAEHEPGCWSRIRAVHRQHHHPPAAIAEALRAAGLDVCGVHGVGEDCVPDPDLDELRHVKVVVVARGS